MLGIGGSPNLVPIDVVVVLVCPGPVHLEVGSRQRRGLGFLRSKSKVSR